MTSPARPPVASSEPAPLHVVAAVYGVGAIGVGVLVELGRALDYLCSPVPAATWVDHTAKFLAYAAALSLPLLAHRRWRPPSSGARLAIGLLGTMAAVFLGLVATSLGHRPRVMPGLDIPLILSVLGGAPLGFVVTLGLELALLGWRWFAAR